MFDITDLYRINYEPPKAPERSIPNGYYATGINGITPGGPILQVNPNYDEEMKAYQSGKTAYDNYNKILDELGANIQEIVGKADTYIGKAGELANSITGYVGQIAGLANQEAQRQTELQSYYENLYRPLNEKFVQESLQGITPDYNKVTRQAIGDVSHAAEVERQNLNRDLMRYGVNPESGRYVGANRAFGLEKAAAEGQAASQARSTEKARVEDVNYQRLTAGMATKPNPEQFTLAPAISGLATGVSAQGTAANIYGGLAEKYLNSAQGAGELVANWAQANQPEGLSTTGTMYKGTGIYR